MKPLNLSPEDRVGCTVTFNVNRYEVNHASGWLMTAAYSKEDLKRQLAENQLSEVVFHGSAARMYLEGVM